MGLADPEGEDGFAAPIGVCVAASAVGLPGAAGMELFVLLVVT
jgi:hypothetical protein